MRDFDVEAKGFTVEHTNVKKKAILSLEKNLKYKPGLVLHFEYDMERFQINSERNVAVTLKKKNNLFVFSKTLRDKEWENEVLQAIDKVGLINKDGYYFIDGIQKLESNNALYYLINWLNENKTKLAVSNIQIVQDKLEKTFFTGTQKLDIKTHAKGYWFDLEAVIQFGEFRIPFLKLKKNILSGIREFVLPNGEVAVLPEEWFARFAGLLPFGKENGNNLQFEKHHFTLLQNEIQKKDKLAFAKYERLLNSKSEKITLPANSKATLRNYQE